jgi:hypothetical protein
LIDKDEQDNRFLPEQIGFFLISIEERVRGAAAQVSPVFMEKEATINKACRTIETAEKARRRICYLS